MRDLFRRSEFHGANLGRNIATGAWPAGGSVILGQPTGHLPPELVRALSRHQDEFAPAIEIWNHTVGDANCQVAFSHYDSKLRENLIEAALGPLRHIIIHEVLKKRAGL